MRQLANIRRTGCELASRKPRRCGAPARSRARLKRRGHRLGRAGGRPSRRAGVTARALGAEIVGFTADVELPPEHVHPMAAPTFLIDPPIPIIEPRRIIVRSTRIQYSQTVVLNFNGILWPHVSVATLIPGEPVSVPPPAWVIKRG